MWSTLSTKAGGYFGNPFLYCLMNTAFYKWTFQKVVLWDFAQPLRPWLVGSC